MGELPGGTVTFLFTDIEGSTRLLHELGDDAYAGVLAQHRRVLRAAFAAHSGIEIETEGDSFFVVFAESADAVAAAVDGQRGLDGGPVRVRMGLHAGTPLRTAEGYVGMVVHRAARISAVGHGGQVLLSEAVATRVDGQLPPKVAIRDLGHVRLKDLSKPEHVYQVLHPDLHERFPALRSLERTPNNLPQQISTFIGREKEMAEARRLLATSRLVTLVGAGGIGKTRLSLQVGAEVLDGFADGVWLVELASLTDARLVPQVVATVLGVKEEAARPVRDALADFVKDRTLLLILDNCEHVGDACAQLVNDLLQSGRDLKVLATSRERLRVGGEQSYVLPALSLPDMARGIDAVAQSEAVQLFVERARRQQPSFALTVERAPAVAQICNALDGIPLALELAAARTRLLSVQEISARIVDRFRLLGRGVRTALPRHQTLRAVIDWSHDLLSAEEQTVFRRLAVFAGGFTLDAAEKVCAGDSGPKYETIESLGALADKSLVSVDEGADVTRYRMLETVRQYAADRLDEAGDAGRWRDAHLEHFVALAEEADSHLVGARQDAWLDRLEMEHDNLRAALDWSNQRPARGGAGLRLAAALCQFWQVRGYQREGRERLAAQLRRPANEQDLRARAKALAGAGLLAWQQNDYQAARSSFQESLEHHGSIGNRLGVATSLSHLGLIARDQGDYQAARALQEESLAIRRQEGSQWAVAASLTNLGIIADDCGDYAAARALHEESLAVWREVHDWGRIAMSLTNLGVLAGKQGDYPVARAFLEESVQRYRELNDREGIAYALLNLGSVAEDEDDYPGARALHGESLAIAREVGNRRCIASALEGLANAISKTIGPTQAARTWGAAERLRENVGAPLAPSERTRYDQQVADARNKLGDDAQFALAWNDGRAMSLEQAIEYALKPSHESSVALDRTAR